jgi:hypothetical protein
MRSTRTVAMRASKMLREQETWRDNGMTYLQYVTIANYTLCAAVKPSLQAKYQRFSTPSYNAVEFNDMGVAEVVMKAPVTVEDMINKVTAEEKK